MLKGFMFVEVLKQTLVTLLMETFWRGVSIEWRRRSEDSKTLSYLIL